MHKEKKFLGRVLRHISSGELYTVVDETYGTEQTKYCHFKEQNSNEDIQCSFTVVPYGQNPDAEDTHAKIAFISYESISMGFVEMTDLTDDAYTLANRMVLPGQINLPIDNKKKASRRCKKVTK